MNGNDTGMTANDRAVSTDGRPMTGVQTRGELVRPGEQFALGLTLSAASKKPGTCPGFSVV